MGRTTWFDGDGMKKGEWTAEEDNKLVAYINEFGLGDWRSLPKRAGLQRCGKSCRLRWLNYLRPGIKRGKFTPQEEEEIIKFHALLGNRWAAIAKQIPNRTDNDIKNHWNSCLKKRLARNGIDPITHEPIVTVASTSSSPAPISSSSSHSSTGSASILNKLASSRHGLDKIKALILSGPNQALQENMINKEEEEEKVIDFIMEMEIDEKLSVDEIASDSTLPTSSFMLFDDFSLTDPFGLYDSEQLDMSSFEPLSFLFDSS